MSNFTRFDSEKTVEQTPASKMPGGTLDSAHNPHYCSYEEQQLYQHLLHLVQMEPPSQMIERCRALFVEGAGYPEPEILLILDKITASKKATEEFKFFLNRCCHILINRWHMQPQLHGSIAELVNLFETAPTKSRTTSIRYREIRRLRELIKLFTTSEQYVILRRFTQVVNQPKVTEDSVPENQPLVTLIRRYPYLYEHCLMSEDSTFEQQQTVKHLQTQIQKKFEVDLSHYVTYKVRRAQVIKKVSETEANRILRPIENPTLLSDRELYATLKQFMGRSDGGQTYQESAQRFLKYSTQVSNFRAFKDDLYEYLISSVDGQYGKRQFNQRLYNQLQNTLPQADSQKLNDFLVVRTCSQLLNFLVVNSLSSPQHFTFVDLITNQGTLVTIGLLLKIVLICRKVRPHLEKRLAVLFNHYESATTNCIGWLVKVLEQLNIALSIHFGNIDLSLFTQMV
ncbi:MAG TPA: hypothetical protein VK203_23640 [Nostocaceae cyanobacterium]|nr:hypothetical protein [Nostocaceae cyanobacterium]